MLVSSLQQLMFYLFNPKHPKSSKEHSFWKNSALLETGTFKWGKITTWQEVQAISAEYERSMKMHEAF